ncbi:hypothetical protein EDEG_04015 [Edhazardia aedis USNM 41457]|uniref:Uncharacterized protein n=1 Tax=Edhazardia aedis (strain USNM 41457) TaxID=1003232 RepID=J8ZNT6_EDHAE|nr:hypothetical protein EDEG_04015 [Edhazardia aedis USNM 41457]|eukprot:EJW01353.1 hypothetical protein EDEG_04015 [Edhazardia aedis USNM 41457]
MQLRSHTKHYLGINQVLYSPRISRNSNKSCEEKPKGRNELRKDVISDAIQIETSSFRLEIYDIKNDLGLEEKGSPLKISSNSSKKLNTKIKPIQKRKPEKCCQSCISTSKNSLLKKEKINVVRP